MPAAFPHLKTGAIIQYPATKSTQHSTFVVRFLDGSDQRYRNYAAPLHRWNIRLDLLDEAEPRTLEHFFCGAKRAVRRVLICGSLDADCLSQL
jgi:hypothetical protein